MNQHDPTQTDRQPLSRRDFVRVLSAAGAAGPGMVAAAMSGYTLTRSQRAEAAGAIEAGLDRLPKHRFGARLGDMMVAPVCICTDWGNPDLYALALSVGMNFVHKAGYWREMPDAFRSVPRESYYCDITVDSTPNNPDDEDKAYNQVVSSLQHSGVGYYDIFRAHFGWRNVQAFKTQTGTYRAFQRLKREGKVRHFGVSQHASPFDGQGWASYPDMIQAEIDSGVIDAMQVWFGYGYPKEVEEVFARASQAGIGMTAMKVFAQGSGRMSQDPARMAEMKAPGMVGRACVRNVLSMKRPDGKPIFATCVSALHNEQQFEENVGGASRRVAERDGWQEPALFSA